MSAWRPYDGHIIPAFYERFEQRWGRGTAPFLDPEVHEQPLPRAQWINPDTGAGVRHVGLKRPASPDPVIPAVAGSTLLEQRGGTVVALG